MRYIHNVFHISLLNPVKSTSLVPYSLASPFLALYVKDKHEFFKIENIFNLKQDNRRLYYFIKWKSFSDSENFWELFSNILARTLVKEFYYRNPDKPGEARLLHFIHLLA